MKNYYAEAISRLNGMYSADHENLWEILIEIAKKHPAVFVKAYDKHKGNTFCCNGQIKCRIYSDLSAKGNLVSAVAACRSATGKGLKEAKDAVCGDCPAWK